MAWIQKGSKRPSHLPDSLVVNTKFLKIHGLTISNLSLHCPSSMMRIVVGLLVQFAWG
jgi:hypothetical protein